MAEQAHTPTPGPWDYVPSTEHHGPYVTSEHGSTICDCYVMSNPAALSVRNGGDSKPINHMAEMADANARLIAAAPDMLAALERIFSFVSYVNIHGLGSQPEPNGEPQPVRVSPEEFGRIFQEIGETARTALAKAEDAA